MRSRPKSPWWSLLATGIGLVLAVTVAILTVSSVIQSQRALDTANTVGANDLGLRRSAATRISDLTAQVNALQSQVRDGIGQVGQLTAAERALAEQVRQLGGVPVVTVSALPPAVLPSPSREVRPAPRTGAPVPALTAGPSPTPDMTGLSAVPVRPAASPSPPAPPVPAPVVAPSPTPAVARSAPAPLASLGPVCITILCLPGAKL